jgi:transcriptional regulator with XRE-family HTH domain
MELVVLHKAGTIQNVNEDADENLTGRRVKALRLRLGRTQDQMADRGGLPRTYWQKVESGKNKATTVAIQEGLAKGFDLSMADLRLYLSCAIDENEAYARRQVAPAAKRSLLAVIGPNQGRWSDKAIQAVNAAYGDIEPSDGWEAALDRANAAEDPPRKKSGPPARRQTPGPRRKIG